MTRESVVLVFASLLFGVACTGVEPESRSSVSPGVAQAEESTPSTVLVPPITTPPLIRVQIVGEDGAPIAGAQVGQDGISDDQGYATISRPFSDLAIRADGYEPGHLEDSGGDLVVSLSPIIVVGVVVTAEGDPLAGVDVLLGGEVATTDDDGKFSFSGQPAGEISVDPPGWHPATLEWSGDTNVVRLAVEPMLIRAVHVTGGAAGTAESWLRLLDLAGSTEINALVVDLKDESGRVFYDTRVDLARTVGAIDVFYRLSDVVSATRDRDLYLIGRIVTFQDPIAAKAAPDLAVQNASSGSPYQKNGQFFLDPTDQAARQYALDLAVEACEAGFDEIQFDYVRYPDGFGSSAVFDGGAAADTRPAVIRDFLAEASLLVHPWGCAVAADIFGFITSATDDGGIGQQLEMLAEVTDVLSPMLYPSHYSEGWFGFSVPNDHPGPVVAGGLDDGTARLDSSTIIRPWIQDFYYSAAQVRAEIDAAEIRDIGWMLWNARSRFSEGALNPPGE